MPVESIITMLTQDNAQLTTPTGDVSAYAWPGGYPLYYLAADNETFCTECVNKHIKRIVDATIDGDNKEWELVARDVNWEDANMQCVQCNKRIESAYAEDSEDEDEPV